MRSCWGDLLLWFICRCKKKSNIPRILQGFRNLQKGHGGTHEPIIHISVENASRKERHSDAVKVESLERFMDTYPLAASKCHEIIFEIQLFCMLVVFYHLILWGMLSSFELQTSS